MTDGIRITQAGSAQSRITQTGDYRITEHAVVAQLALAATVKGAPVPVKRVRAVQAQLSVHSQAFTQVNGKVAASALMTAVSSASAQVNAQHVASADLQSIGQFFGAVGRSRTGCVHMHATPAIDVQPSRIIPAFLAWDASNALAVSVGKHSPAALATGTQIVMADVPVMRLRAVQAHFASGTNLTVAPNPSDAKRLRAVNVHWTVSPTITAGQNLPAIQRLTESGDIRRTQVSNTRVLEHSLAFGNILVRRPIFKTWVKRNGLWYVMEPFAHHASDWKVPAHVYIKDDGVWRYVKTTQPRE